MKKLLFLFLLINSVTRAQTLDYKTVRKSLTTISCNPTDSLVLINTTQRLEAFDTTQISINMHIYYYDLGMCYYKRYCKSQDSIILVKTIATFDKALYHKPDYSSALWNNFLLNSILGKCETGIIYLKRYKKATPRKYWHRKDIKSLNKRCK